MRRPLPPDVIRRLDSDPLFQVMTADQQHWIDPYTGTPVPASLGRVPAAREYLTEAGVWKDNELLPRQALEVVKWRLDLMRLLPIEPRLRIFGRDGMGWLNPFTGELIQNIAREEGKITGRTVLAMAQHLSTCQRAAGGRPLDGQTLIVRMQALGIAPQQAAPIASAPAHAPGASTSTEMSDDMARAKSVQQHMLADLPEIPGFELAVHYTGHSGVSGDFYEVIRLHDGRVLILLGDVSGHGMQAALVVATALKTLRFLARQTNDLVTLLTQFNDEVRTDLLPGQFITLFAAILDPDTRRMLCVRAGHHHALLANLAGASILRRIGQQGVAIGLVPGATFTRSIKPEVIELQPGDVLLQYTDGLTEAADAEGNEYGEGRMCGCLLAGLDLPLQELVDGMAEDVLEFAGGNLADDLTLLTLAVLTPIDDDAETEGAEGQG
jgi:serine phosphatase RsbU (regulator of sigma subunit)